jgi:hypothetical protein
MATIAGCRTHDVTRPVRATARSPTAEMPTLMPMPMSSSRHRATPTEAHIE